MRRTIAILFLAVLLTPTIAVADSDGYYCVGRGYIAFETRFSTPASGHLLYVVRFSRSQGIVALSPIALDDFQVQGMTCGPTAVALTDGTTRYAVNLAELGRPVVTTEAMPFDPKTPTPANLGHWARDTVIDLEGDGPPGQFQLVISRVSRTITGGIEHYTFSRLVRRDPKPGGFILESASLFEGIFLESVD
jgi:hypothetical protein